MPRLLVFTSTPPAHWRRAYLSAEAKDEDILGIPDIVHLCQLLLQLSLHRTMQRTSSAKLLLNCSLSGWQLQRSTENAEACGLVCSC